MSVLLLILDGLQDIPYPALGERTPYEAGRGKHFRLLEENSRTGLLVTTPSGFIPDTQTCMLTLLGVPPAHIPPGRSYLEAQARGLQTGEDDLVLRCSFVRAAPDGTLENPCCRPPAPVVHALLDAVRAEGYEVVPTGSYKNLQRIPGGAPYYAGMRTWPPHQHKGEPLARLFPTGNLLAASLADFSRHMLMQYAPYTVLHWGQAVRAELPSFHSLHGKTGAMVAKTDVLVGLAHAMGMQCPALPTCTGDTDTDLAAKANAALELAKTNDVVVLHIGGTDEATHRQSPIEKAMFVEKLDAQLLAPLLAGCADGTVLLLTSDHEALCATGGHTDKPVRFWLYEKGARLQGDCGLVPGEKCVRFACGEWRK